MKHQTETQPTIIDQIGNAVADGNVGHIKVSKCLTTLYRVETSNGNSHYIDGETGLNVLIQPSRNHLGMIAQNLTVAMHANAGFNYSVIDVASKMLEANTLKLPLSLRDVSEYRGTFQATKLDFVVESRTSNLSAAELIGLSESDGDGNAKRLYNVEGSISCNDKQGFNRKAVTEDAVLYFNTGTGEYALVKTEACSRYYAPLVGITAQDLSDDHILQGLDSAPTFNIAESVSAVALNSRR